MATHISNERNRRNAQLGLIAATMLLIGCFSILFVHDRAAARQESNEPSAPKIIEGATPTVSAVTPKL